MKDDDILDLTHTVESLDADLSRIQQEVMKLKEDNKRLLNFVFQLADAVNVIPRIMDDSSQPFRYQNEATREFRNLIDLVIRGTTLRAG
jgi:hypothetical protein